MKLNMKEEKKATRQSYGEALLELGKENSNVVGSSGFLIPTTSC